MKEKNAIIYIIPLVVLVAVIIAGLVYYQKNQKNATSNPVNLGGIVLGENNSSATSVDSSLITDGQIYANKISEIRPPINKGFEDLASKAKYSTLFNSDEIQKIIDDTRQKVKEGIKILQDLYLDPKFNTANTQEIKSLDLLLEAINAFEKARVQTDKEEAQRLGELYAYNIEQSNKILKEIQIPR